MSTTFPIDVTIDRLIEFTSGVGTIRIIGLEEIGRDVFLSPSPTVDDAAGAIMLQMALEGASAEDLRAWLHDQPEAIAWRTRPPDPIPIPPDPIPPLPEPGEESGPLEIDRPTWRDQNGDCWVWRGFTDFLLFYRYLTGVNIAPFLEERLALGANLLRVFSMVGWAECQPPFYPQNFDDYYGRLREFADILADAGLRLELTVFADATIVMPDAQARRDHLANCISALQGTWNTVVEVANEPWQNLPGGNEEAIQLAVASQGLGLLIASGEYSSWPPAQTADYGTTHCDRTEDWPRKGKDIMDRQDESGDTPWIGDEPMGAAEVDEPGRRDADPDDHAWYAACTRMFGAGATFHCEDGIHSRTPIGPTQTACAQAFFFALQWVPPEALMWPYQRGDMGSEAGIGDMPILHDDALETRSYCKGDGATEWCIQIQTSREHATPRDGWRIVEEPRKGFVKLVKP
jgi:hypothetical protein